MWTITDGNYYVSQGFGSDSNAGTQAAPFASIGAATAVASSGQKIVVGVGIYEEQVSGVGEQIYGEGVVIVDGQNIAGSTTGFQSVGLIDNLWVRNFVTIINSTGANNCTFSGFTSVNLGLGVTHKGCAYQGTMSSISAGQFINCGFYSSNLTGAFEPDVIKNCAFDKFCGNINTDPANVPTMDYNCFEGSVTIGGLSFAAWQAANPTKDVYSINPADALINDRVDFDFTLATTSTLIGAGEGGVTIGPRRVAVSLDGLNSLLDGSSGVGAKDGGITINGTTGHIGTTSSGDTITSDYIPITTGTTDIEGILGRIRIQGSWNPAAGDEFNSNNGTTQPDHFAIELRHGADNTACGAATWYDYQVGMPILFDSTNTVGNAENTYSAANGSIINTTVIQLRITLLEG